VRAQRFVRLNTKQAKDVLVEQATEQAALENLPFSDIEKRMMYFTESDPVSCPDPLALNDEFEAQHDTPEYEAKMSRLLRHVYDRLKAEDPEGKRVWDQSVRELRKGDHYVLVLLDVETSSEHPAHDSAKLIGTGLLIVLAVGIAAFVIAKYNIDVERYQKVLIFIFIIGFLIATGTLRALYRVAVVWFHRRTNENE
jgi:hypothetical protein